MSRVVVVVVVVIVVVGEYPIIELRIRVTKATLEKTQCKAAVDRCFIYILF